MGPTTRLEAAAARGVALLWEGAVWCCVECVPYALLCLWYSLVRACHSGLRVRGSLPTSHTQHKTRGQQSDPSLLPVLSLWAMCVCACAGLTPGGGGEEHPREAQEASHSTSNHLATTQESTKTSTHDSICTTYTMHMPTPSPPPL